MGRYFESNDDVSNPNFGKEVRTMRHMLKKEGFLFGVLIFVFVLGLGTSAQAVPDLGVGTGYIGTAGCGAALNYWECFSGNSASGSGESFALPASGTASGVTVWSSIAATNIWLLGDPSIGTFSFAGQDSIAVAAVNNQIVSYVGPFQGINLGVIDGSWSPLPQPPFSGSDPFYGLTGTLTYSGTNVVGDWMFLVADIGNDYNSSSNPFDPPENGDKFSPKTTSATGTSVPEAGALLMFGSGLIGLVGYRRMSRMQ